MNSINALNIYLNNNRKYMLIVLNALVIFVILEIMIWNEVNGLLSAEEYRKMRDEICQQSDPNVFNAMCNMRG